MNDKKLRIAFVWYFDQASKVIDNWKDGLRSAMEIIAKKHHVDWYLDKKLPQGKYDWILVWCDAQSEFLDIPYDAKKGIFLTALPQDYSKIRGLDVVFCESQPILDAVRAQGCHAVKAFGTDTDFFQPSAEYKNISFFYPATFSPWKRQSEIAYLGDQLLCVGTLQPDGQVEYQACIDNGVKVELGYFPARKILSYYQRSNCVIIPAIHGSERTVLEAMSCNMLPQILHPLENSRAFSCILEYQDSGTLTPRDFVVKNYSHKAYADTILRIIEE